MSRKLFVLGLFVLFSQLAAAQVSAQEVRPRLASPDTQTANKIKSNVRQYPRQPEAANDSAARPSVNAAVVSRPAGASRSVLTNDILVRPTVSTVPANSSATAKSAVSAVSAGAAAFRRQMLTAMNGKLGIPYRYGSQGPNSYDCSGLVWTIFGESGVSFERTSAATFWNQFEPAADEDKYRFGTLVFFNGLKHVGIVIDENTFYHASSSQGVTFSSFEGYWGKRITGFRRVPISQLTNFIE